MNLSLVLLFLFSVGSLFGWGLEVLFRRFFSKNNPERKWINPGFLTGPALPLYGSGLVLLFLIAQLEKHVLPANPVLQKIVLFAMMAEVMTAIEYIAGWGCLKFAHVRLWDYTGMWGNIQGLICPLFSFFWTVLGAVYYFAIHPYILDALTWLSQNLAFSFFIGFFYGIFVIDLAHATQIMVTLRRFAAEKQIVIRYEELREQIRSYKESRLIRAGFFFSMVSDRPLAAHLAEYHELVKSRADSFTEKIARRKN